MNWKKERIETRAWLHDRFPAAFMTAGAQKVPLKVGIREDVFATIKGLDSAPSKAAIVRAIADYASGPTYLLNCREGALRVDLYGVPVGSVAAQEERFAFTEARRMLARMRKAPKQTDRFKSLLVRIDAEIAAHEARFMVPA